MKRICTYFILVVLFFTALPCAEAQDAKATLEVVAVDFKMDENEILSVRIKANEELTIVDYESLRKDPRNFLAENKSFIGSNIELLTNETRAKYGLHNNYLIKYFANRLVDNDYEVINYDSYFEELRSDREVDYKIAVSIQDVLLNVEAKVGGRTSIISSSQCVINYHVNILDCQTNSLAYSKSHKKKYSLSEENAVFVVLAVIPSQTTEMAGVMREYIYQLVDDMLAQPEIEALFSNKSEPASTQFADAISFSNAGAPTAFSAAKLVESSVTLSRGSVHGSGTFISTDGLILTCEHVLGNADEIDIYLNNSVHMKGKVVRRNKEKDVALVKVNGITTVPVRLATSRPEIGTDVYAVGTPADRQLNQTITKGILSGQRTLEGINYLQTDASISPGNSGGALTNGKGELVGIVTSKLIGVGAEGLGFAIPLSEALEAVNATVAK